MSYEGQCRTWCLVTVGVVTNELFCTCNVTRWSSMHHCFSVPPLTEEISWTTKGDYVWRSRTNYQITLACSVTYKYHNPNISLSGGLFFFFFLTKCHHVWTNDHTSVLRQCLQVPFSFFHCGIKEIPSNTIRGEWEQCRRGAGNSNFVQPVPAVTSLHLNEPLDNPQKYDPSKGGKAVVCSRWVPGRVSFNRSLTS